MTPLLTVILPTLGRPTLEAAVQSVRQQLPPACCEILLVMDTHPSHTTRDEARVHAVAAQYTCRVEAYDGGVACYGHPQRNYGMTRAQGTWLAFLQDDDCWLPGAGAAIMQSCLRPPQAPRLFRTDTWQAGVVWRTPELVVGNIDADCIVTPNVAGRLGWWQLRYEGDFDFIQQTCTCWGQCIWETEVIAVGRPHARGLRVP
jgi:hypothetical protein